jgi:hypothetical protein
VEGSLVAVGVVGADAAHMAEGARRQQKAIEEVLSEAVGRPIRLALRESSSGEVRDDRPKRLSDKDLKADKLREIRGLDPALDAAAEALDLEIVE